MHRTGESITILHVDDEPRFAEMAATFVEQENDRFTVETVQSASEGLDRLDDGAYDCVVSDYDMPEQNGIEFLETLRNSYPDIPFILFTGKGSEEVASEAISAGVTDYLQKGGTETYQLLANRIERAVTESRLQEFRRGMKQDPLVLIEHLADPLFTLNKSWEFTYLNMAAEEQFGMDRDELLGSSLRERFPDGKKTAFYDAYRETMASGEPHTFEAKFDPWGKWYREHLYPSDEGLTVISQEITDEKQQEFELNRKRELLRHVETITKVGGWEVNTETMETHWTEGTYRIHGLDPDGEFNPTVDNAVAFYHPEDQDTIRTALDRCIADKDPYELELRLTTDDGEERVVRTHGEPVCEDGDVVVVRGAIQDITDRH